MGIAWIAHRPRRVAPATGFLILKYTLATALAACLVPAAAGRAAAMQVPPRADSVPWTLPVLREPLRSFFSPPAPVPSVRLGRARIPLTRFVSPLAGLPMETVPFPDWTPGETLRFGALGPPIGYLDIPNPRARSPDAGGDRSTGRFVNEYANLGFSLRGSGEIGGDWTAFRPCDETVQVTCEVSLLPQVTPDIRFAATADGTITDRILVDVDYDQTREFQGANRLNIHYQGMPGEILQRFEVGDVRFDLPSSRFFREAVPAGNFGFQATLRAGPVDVRSVWAQQAGEVTSRRFRLESSGRGYSRSDTLVLDDADYLEGQFFFLFDPAAFLGYPHIDVLSLSRADAAPTFTRARNRFSCTARRSTSTRGSRWRGTSRPTRSRARAPTPSPSRPGSSTSSPARTTWSTRAGSGSLCACRCGPTKSWG